MNTAHYKGAIFSPQHILNEKTFQAVKNQIQRYLLWSFLSAALISNTRSRSHFCWISLSIFFKKSTFAVPLRSCSTEKGREAWLNRLRNNRTVTDHRPLLNSFGYGQALLQNTAATPHSRAAVMTLQTCIPRSSLLNLDLRPVRKGLTTFSKAKDSTVAKTHTHTDHLANKEQTQRDLNWGGRRGYKS